jgi:hypothetical protein
MPAFHRRARFSAALLVVILLASLLDAFPADASTAAAASTRSQRAPKVDTSSASENAPVPSTGRGRDLAGSLPADKDPFDPTKATPVDHTVSNDVYRNADGTYTLRAFGGPVNFKDAAGNWQRIDTTVVRDANGGLHNKAGANRIAFPAASGKGPLVTVDAGPNAIGLGLDGAESGRPATSEKSHADFAGVLPGVDQSFRVVPEGVDDTLILRDSSAAGTGHWTLPLTLRGLRAQAESNGAISFRDGAGRPVAVMPSGVASDSAGKAPGGVSADTRVNVALTADGTAIDVSVDPVWLTDRSRVYPIAIDPLINLGYETGGHDAYAGSGCGNCNYYNETIDKLGYATYNGGFWQFDSFLYYDLGRVAGAFISHGYWNGIFTAGTGTFRLYPMAQPWQDSDIHWDNLSNLNHRSDYAQGAPGVGSYSRDIDYWVGQWALGPANGGWANYGVSMDTFGITSSYWELASDESTSPTAQKSWIDVSYDHGPSVPTNLAPASGTRVGSLTPALSSTYTHPDADEPGFCLAEVWTSDLSTEVGGGWIINDEWVNGALPAGSTCHDTVPGGWLAWGTTYQWRTHGKDLDGHEGPYTGFLTFTTPTTPAAPASASASIDGCETAAVVSWTAPSQNGGTAVTGYRVTTLNPDGSVAAGVPMMTTGATTTSATITGLGRAASYEFNVAATNAAGTGPATTTGSVTVVATASAPQNVTATAGTNGTTATVAWTPPQSDGGSAVTGYTVRTYTSSGIATGNNVGPPATAVQATVNGLTPGSTYQFGVTAENCAGSSPESGRAALTEPNSPSAPQSVTATGGVGTIKVQWSAPAQTNGAAITSYTAHLYRSDGTDTGLDSGTLAATTTQYTFSGRPKATSYYALVYATNSVGTSPAGQSGTATTDDVPTAAQTVAATGGVGSITASWSRPASNGGSVVTSYTIHLFTAAGADTGSQQTTNGSTFSATFTGLPRNTAYYVTVTDANAVGAGPSAQSPNATTNDLPGAPRSVAAQNDAQPGSADVSWAAPASNGGAAITAYTVRTYNADGTAATGVAPVTVCGTCTSALVSGLAPSHGYLFGVTATNGVGAGPEARTTTPVATPEAFTLVKSWQPLASSPVVKGAAVTYALALHDGYPNDQAVATLVDTVPSQLAAEGTAVQVSWTAAGQSHNQTVQCTTTAPSGSALACLLDAVAADGSRPLRILNMPAFGGDAQLSFPAVLVGDDLDCSSATNAASGTDTGGGQFSASTPITFCDTGLGLEAWQESVSRPIANQGTAFINPASGNLVVQQTDSTPVQAHGRFDYVLRRTYNSQDTTIATLPGSIGAGWTWNVAQSDDLAGDGIGASHLYVPPVSDPIAAAVGVTLVDRDGTRHVFRPKGVSAAAAVSGLPGVAAPRALTPAIGATVCVDVTYNPPPGVHLGLWRYLQVTPITPGSCTPAAGTTPQVLGFGAERPDRVRYEFDATGELVDMQDGAGVELRYLYEGTPGIDSRLSAVFEWNSCLTGTSHPTTRDAIPATCRAFRFTYSTSEIDVVDPAGRTTSYSFDNPTTGPRHLLTVTDPDHHTLIYSYGGCGGNADQLCSATDRRSGITTFTYQAGPAGSQPQVNALNDRKKNVSTDNNGETLSVTYASGSTTFVQDTHQEVFQGIDSAGRVAEIDEGRTPAPGATTWTIRHKTVKTWDTRGAPCRQPDNAVDNDLCEQVRDHLLSATPSEDTQFLYNAEGRVNRTGFRGGSTFRKDGAHGTTGEAPARAA